MLDREWARYLMYRAWQLDLNGQYADRARKFLVIGWYKMFQYKQTKWYGE